MVSTLGRIRTVPAQLAASLRRPKPRTVPAAVLPGSELIHLGGGESVPCPGIESLPLAPYARQLGLGSSTLALPPARVHVLHDVIVRPGARVVVDRAGRVVAESLTAEMDGRIQLDAERPSSPVEEIDGTIAMFRSPWRPYFHTLISHLPRAALLAQPAVRRLGPVTVVHDGPLDPVEALFLPRLLGPRAQIRQVEPGVSLRADRVLLPGYVTRPGAGAIPSWYRRWIDREADVISTGRRAEGADSPPRRIFVDRTQGARRVINRSAVDEVLQAHGVEAVDPRTMSVDERVRCFRDADLVVGVTGSGLANLLFSRSAHVLELLPGSDMLPHCFYLCASKGLPYDYLPVAAAGAGASSEKRLQRGVVVDVGALDAALERLG